MTRVSCRLALIPLLVIVWLALALLLRGRLTRQDRKHQFDSLTETESGALKRAQEMFEHGHYDLSVIEVWRALEARLRRALLRRSVHGHYEDWSTLRDAVNQLNTRLEDHLRSHQQPPTT